MKTIKIVLVALLGVLAVGCYNDFDTPAPRKLYKDEDMALMGLQQKTIKEIKDKFVADTVFRTLSGTGTNKDWATTNTLKFGRKSSIEKDFVGLKEWPDAANFYIKGKVISSDRQGNIYKSLYIYDGTAAIELKLYNGLYLDYYLNLDAMESQWVYVRLDGLYLGNYRMMLSIGSTPSDGVNIAGTHKFYANSNVDNPAVAALNFFPGERVALASTDIKEVDASNYATLGEADYGRLVRFKNVQINYAGVTYQNPIVDASGAITGWSADITKPAVVNGSNSNPYPSWIVTDWGNPQFGAWYRWAFNGASLPEEYQVEKNANVRLYGSVMMTYDTSKTSTTDPGVYSIRTSGYAQFAMRPIPADGTTGTVLGIYSIYASEIRYAQYQITVSRLEDLDFPAESLLSSAWMAHNTPAASYVPNVKSNDNEATE